MTKLDTSGRAGFDCRTVRIFISSTFRDFAEERDLLVRKVFLEIRRRCRERQVELVDVDLNWGITEAEAEQRKVLPICLAEIDRARPFFMELLGERYGWVPAAAQLDRSLLIEQPWLEEHAGGRSVTELKVLHGVLNNPQMAGRAFFYFRDPAWSATQGAEDVPDTLIDHGAGTVVTSVSIEDATPTTDADHEMRTPLVTPEISPAGLLDELARLPQSLGGETE